MASRITAIRKFRPELRRGRTLNMGDVVELIARSTGLNEGEIRFVVYELRDLILMAAHRGQAVKIEGMGIFTPTIRSDGEMNMLFRADKSMRSKLHVNYLSTNIINKDSIGKSADELVAMWNAAHPEDPVEG
ncbi:MAG: hypothetical protein AB1846_08565 [Chloroflexota bacterium]